MKNKRILFFTKILSVIFIIGTVISFFIVYQDLNGSIATTLCWDIHFIHSLLFYIYQ